MQYTLRNIPAHLDREIRDEAQRAGKSINQLVLERLMQAFGLTEETPRRRNLGNIAGTWVEDPAVDDALEAQRSVDEDLWS